MGVLRLDHPLWQAAHRPLFFCAGLGALVAPGVWLWPGGFGADPVRWHLHELLFGMGGAAVGGYLLTALPSWTGRGPVSPQSVRALTLLWLVARIAMLGANILPFWLLFPLTLGYFGVLALIFGRQLVAAWIWSRMWAIAGVAGLMLGNAVVLADMRGLLDDFMAPLVIALLFATLISIIGGRAVPAFTRSWLHHSAAPRHVRDHRTFSALAIAATVLGGGLSLAGQQGMAGVCLLGAGVLQGVRIMGWQTRHTRHYPALFLLHLAWVWVPLGLILVGAAMLYPDVMPQSAALHGLTMGAMGTMVLAISGRAAMTRQGSRLIAGRGFTVAFALIWLAALLRVASAFVSQEALDPIAVSAAMWMMGWAIYLWAYRSALYGPIPWPVLSVQKRENNPPRLRSPFSF